jgi:hypothetical protein
MIAAVHAVIAEPADLPAQWGTLALYRGRCHRGRMVAFIRLR